MATRALASRENQKHWKEKVTPKSVATALGRLGELGFPVYTTSHLLFICLSALAGRDVASEEA